MQENLVITIINGLILISNLIVFIMTINKYNKIKDIEKQVPVELDAEIDQSKALIKVGDKKYSLGELNEESGTSELVFKDSLGNKIITFNGKLIE